MRLLGSHVRSFVVGAFLAAASLAACEGSVVDSFFFETLVRLVVIFIVFQLNFARQRLDGLGSRYNTCCPTCAGCPTAEGIAALCLVGNVECAVGLIVLDATGIFFFIRPVVAWFDPAAVVF